jgi:hypothetical protein
MIMKAMRPQFDCCSNFMILIAFTTIGPVFPVLFLRAVMSGPKFLSSGKGSVDSPFVKASVKMLAGNPWGLLRSCRSLCLSWFEITLLG